MIILYTRTFIFSLLFFFVLGDLCAKICRAQKTNAQTEKTLYVELEKNNSEFKILGKEILIENFLYNSSTYSPFKDEKYNGRVVSFSQKSLGFFGLGDDLDVVVCKDAYRAGPDSNIGCRSENQGITRIKIPYFPNGKYADIYDPFGKKVLTIDLSSKATCNEDGKCDQPIEDSENCPQDCKKQEPKLDPILVKKAQETTDKSEKDLLSDFSWWWLMIIFIMLLSGGAIGYYVYNKRNNKLSDYY